MSQSIYQFANFQFDPESNLLTDVKNVNTSPVQLDPKVSALLAYFLTKPQTLITKSELFTNVWQDHKLTDSTVSWALSQLRKALGDDALSPTYVKTVPKQGFQFLPSVSVITTKQHSKSTSLLPSNQLFYTALIASILFSIIGVIAYQYSATKTGRLAISPTASVTALDGIEIDPELSPNHKWLLFRHKENMNNATYQLYLAPWLDGKSANVAINLTQDEHLYSNAVWGKNSDEIFAVKQTQSPRNCAIVKLALNRFHSKVAAEIKLKNCHGHGSTTLVYHENTNSLFFTDQQNEPSYSLYQLSLDNNEIVKITDGPQEGRGIHFISPSLDKEKLLLVSQVQETNSAFLLFDIATKNIETIFTSPATHYFGYLSPASDAIWLNTESNDLIAYHWQTTHQQTLLKNNAAWNYNLKPITHSLSMYSTANSPDVIQSQADIKLLNND